MSSSLLPGTSPDWMPRGACQREDPELFFPIAAAGPALAQITAAKAVCFRCAVRAARLSYALVTLQAGIWGGTTQEERQAIRRRSGHAAPRRQPGPRHLAHSRRLSRQPRRPVIRVLRRAALRTATPQRRSQTASQPGTAARPQALQSSADETARPPATGAQSARADGPRRRPRAPAAIRCLCQADEGRADPGPRAGPPPSAQVPSSPHHTSGHGYQPGHTGGGKLAGTQPTCRPREPRRGGTEQLNHVGATNGAALRLNSR